MQLVFECGAKECKSELGACVADSACPAAFNCGLNCGDDDACGQACLDSAPPATKATILALVECAEDNCSMTSPSCGDGACEGGETKMSCPLDCNDCDNGVCDAGEDDMTCPEDCAKCGDGKCTDSVEDPSSCPGDCPPVCGDFSCDPPETETSCAQDCKVAVCGDGACDKFDGENCQSCNKDCGPCVPSDGCTESVSPGCAGCVCEACVCAADPFCCNTAWDGLCTGACGKTCGQTCP